MRYPGLLLFLLLLPVLSYSQQKKRPPYAVLKIDLLPNPELDPMVRKSTTEILIYKYDPAKQEIVGMAKRILKNDEKKAVFLFERSDTFRLNIQTSIQMPTSPGHYKDVWKKLTKQVIISTGDTTFLRQVYPSPCVYDKSVNNKVCPKCKKTDMVHRLVWGDSGENVISNGSDDTWFDMDRETTGCDPNWYCLRDKLAF